MRVSYSSTVKAALACLILMNSLVAAEGAEPGLWVSEPETVAIAIGNMTVGANNLGLTDAGFEKELTARLSNAGLKAHRADEDSDESILFLDLVVEQDTFVASLEFWRKAEYQLPDGTSHSDFVIVWEKYTLGAHSDRPEFVADSVAAVLDSFIVDYGIVNQKILTSRL
jgi:hypothetical protein